MRKIRLDTRIRYQGHGDVWPDGPPNYFQKLFIKYTAPKGTRPDWLRHYFPDDEVQHELICLRKEAVYYMLEAAKMRVRTTTGWHGRRTVTEQRVLGGRLARLRHQSANGTQIAEVESELRALRERKKITRYKVEDLLDQAQYRWHTAMFTATEYLRTKRVLLPSRANRGLCDWLSFPEVGIRCTGGTIKSARRHFYIERRNGRSFRVYQYQIPRNIKGLTKPELENSAQLNDQVLLYRSFNCHRCGRQMVGKVTGLHLAQEEHIPIESIGLSLDPAEFYRTDNDETLASLTEDSL